VRKELKINLDANDKLSQFDRLMKNATQDETKFNSITARTWAKEIADKCSECYPAESVKARKFLGQWVIDINGGSGACYGKTIKTTESAQDVIRIFAN